jgi:Core-2/I-Branching enzyme
MPSVPIAYLILAHKRPLQLARLVDRLRTPNSRFFVHVSARTPDDTYAAMQSAVGDTPEVHWLPRVPVYYGGFSLVRATLFGIQAILRDEPRPGHAVLLSGQDYPLCPAAEIERYLAARPGISFLHSFRIPAHNRWPDEDGGLDRIRGYYLERISYRTRMLRVPFVRRRFPPGLTPYGGSTWWALAEEALVELDRFAQENPSVLAFFQHVKMADEVFVPSVLMSSAVAERIVNDPVHHVEWQNGAHPVTFTAADLERLLASRKLFARKFDDHVDGAILDLLDWEAQPARAGAPA